MFNTEIFTPWVLLTDLGIISALLLVGNAERDQKQSEADQSVLPTVHKVEMPVEFGRGVYQRGKNAEHRRRGNDRDHGAHIHRDLDHDRLDAHRTHNGDIVLEGDDRARLAKSDEECKADDSAKPDSNHEEYYESHCEFFKGIGLVEAFKFLVRGNTEGSSLALAYIKQIKEVGNGLGIISAGTATYDYRIVSHRYSSFVLDVKPQTPP